MRGWFLVMPLFLISCFSMKVWFFILKKLLSNILMTGKGEGIVIAPHVAGHLLGGTLWKITKDGEDVIYAVDFNHRKERYSNCCYKHHHLH